MRNVYLPPMIPRQTDSFDTILASLGPPTARQVAALCWRPAGDSLTVLLVTTRRTRRWTPPKGGLIDGRTAHESAEIEAWEEAGVIGEVSPIALGEYQTLKFREGKGWEKLAVTVYPLLVQSLEADYPERGVRKLRFFAAKAAARAVREPDLKAIIDGFRG